MSLMRVSFRSLKLLASFWVLLCPEINAFAARLGTPLGELTALPRTRSCWDGGSLPPVILTNKTKDAQSNYTNTKLKAWFRRLLHHPARKRSGSILHPRTHTGGIFSQLINHRSLIIIIKINNNHNPIFCTKKTIQTADCSPYMSSV